MPGATDARSGWVATQGNGTCATVLAQDAIFAGCCPLA